MADFSVAGLPLEFIRDLDVGNPRPGPLAQAARAALSLGQELAVELNHARSSRRGIRAPRSRDDSNNDFTGMAVGGMAAGTEVASGTLGGHVYHPVITLAESALAVAASTERGSRIVGARTRTGVQPGRWVLGSVAAAEVVGGFVNMAQGGTARDPGQFGEGISQTVNGLVTGVKALLAGDGSADLTTRQWINAALNPTLTNLLTNFEAHWATYQAMAPGNVSLAKGGGGYAPVTDATREAVLDRLPEMVSEQTRVKNIKSRPLTL